MIVSNDPSRWPQISANVVGSYVSAASCTMLVYDWALTFGQELELVWRQRCSLMTVMYLCVRYGGILYSSITMLADFPSVSVTDLGCNIVFTAQSCVSVVENAILGVIMITRLHAMYQRSRIMLVFLVVFFLALTIASVVIAAIQHSYHSWEELSLFGTYQCVDSEGFITLKLVIVTWILGSVWEVLALCLALRVAVKHLRESRRFKPSTGQTIEDCFTVLLKSHVLYFVVFAAVPCLTLGLLSPQIYNSTSVGVQVYYSTQQITLPMQMFVLGPRLILSVREYHAKLMANSEAGTGISTIAFQERTHVSTGGDV